MSCKCLGSSGNRWEILELGLREWLSSSPGYAGLGDVLETLARLPSSEEVLGLRPATHLQDRIEELLAKNRAGGLSAEEQREWERYQYIEHLVRLAKVRAIQRQAQRRAIMSATHVSASLRRLVRERAGECCEYCLIPEAMTWALHTIDHIIAEKHGGTVR